VSQKHPKAIKWVWCSNKGREWCYCPCNTFVYWPYCAIFWT